MSSPRTTAGCIAIIVLVGLAAYHNSFNCPFVFDDFSSIHRNPTIRSLWPIWPVFSPPQKGEAIQNRPIPNLTLAINYAVHGTRVVGYHVVNLLFHVLAALALFGLIRRTLRASEFTESLKPPADSLALTAAVLWVVHPLTTEAVTYIIQRPECMMGLFYLLTLYCLVRGASSANGKRWYAASVLACAVGMGCKEAMVTAPFMALLYDRTFLAGSFKAALERRKILYSGLAATWIILVLILIDSAGQRGTAAGFGHSLGPWEYLRTQFGAVLLYLRLCFWPAPLVFDYGAPVARRIGEILPQAVVVCSLGAATLWALVRRPRIGFLGAWFFVILAPSSSVIPLVTQTIAEKRMYLPLAGVVCAVVVGAWLLFRRLKDVHIVYKIAVLCAVALVLLFRTISRNADYQSGLFLWQVTVADRPDNLRAHTNLGIEYSKAGKHDLALKEFSLVVERDPKNVSAYYNRSVTWGKVGDFHSAWLDVKRALDLSPEYVDAITSRGVLRALRGDLEEGLEDLNRAVQLDPRSAHSFYVRSVLHGRRGDFDSLLLDSNRVIELNPGHARAYSNRGMAYGRKGSYELALKDLDRAIELDPGCAQAHYNRAIVHREMGNQDRALIDYHMAVRINPQLKNAQDPTVPDLSLFDW